jgi:hypothetical protein
LIFENKIKLEKKIQHEQIKTYFKKLKIVKKFNKSNIINKK